jgi:hypothetical protein
MLIYTDDARCYDVAFEQMLDDKIYCTYKIIKDANYQSSVADFYELRNIATRCELDSVHYDIVSIAYESFADFKSYQMIEVVLTIKPEHQN